MSKLINGAAVLAAVLAATPAAAEFQDRDIKVANGVFETHPVAKGIDVMNECVEGRSSGKMKLTPYYGGSLGGDLKGTQSLRSGMLEMVVTSTSPLVGLVPEVGVFDLPFLFNNEEEADAVLDGDFGAFISEKLPPLGLVNLAFWENGFRNVANSKHPVNTLEDLKGLKIRVMQNNIYLDTFNALGTNATPMPGEEVFPALETHAIDGHENPVVNIETSNLYEVQKYLSLTAHTYTPFLVLYSKTLFDQLSAEEQAALRECAEKGGKAQRLASRDATLASIETLKQKGMEIVEVAPEELERMKKAVQPVYERHSAEIGDETIAKVREELSKIRGN
jgi:tripartite ATP-independent transporter DctP family solute receptor